MPIGLSGPFSSSVSETARPLAPATPASIPAGAFQTPRAAVGPRHDARRPPRRGRTRRSRRRAAGRRGGCAGSRARALRPVRQAEPFDPSFELSTLSHRPAGRRAATPARRRTASAPRLQSPSGRSSPWGGRRQAQQREEIGAAQRVAASCCRCSGCRFYLSGRRCNRRFPASLRRCPSDPVLFVFGGL